MSTPACPEPARLAEYCLGKLPWEELERLEQHLDDCPSCQQTLNQLERPSDTFVRKMRAGEAVAAVAAPPAAPHLHEAELKAALARALQAPLPEVHPPTPHPSGIGKASEEKPRDSRIPQTVADFLQLLAASQLMTAAEAQAFLDTLPPRHQPADAKAAAALFAHACKLTPYQARALYQGKPNNLLIAEREVLDLLGKGGMGNVFKARNRRLDRLEAIKVISSKKLDSPDAKERFNREARAAARLNHPNVVATYDAGEVNGVNFLSMEFVDGLDLSKTVKQRGPLPVEHAVNCILQAAAGLQAAHDAGIIHRDIKPHNLLLDRQGHVKVLDLGLARMNDSASLAANEGLTQSGQVMGTIDYMSPEQTIDVRKVTPASDVYSLGCTLHFLLTGRPPFTAETLGAKMMAHHHEAPPCLTAVCPQASPALDSVFQKMLAKDPAQRYATMDDVIAALQSLTQHAAPADQPLLPPPLPSEEKEDRKLSEFLSVMAVSQELPPPLVRQKPAPPFAASTVAAANPSRALSPAVAVQQPGNSPYSPAQIFLAALLSTVLLGGLVLFGVILWIRTLDGTIEIKLGEGVKPADVEIVLTGDGQTLNITEKSGPADKDGFSVQVRNGKYEVALRNKVDRLKLDKKSLEITRNGIVALRVTQIPLEPEITDVENPVPLPTKPGWTDQLALVDPDKHAKVGSWKRAGNAVGTTSAEYGQRIYSPNPIAGSYRLECELALRAGSEFGMILPVGDASILLLWHGEGTRLQLDEHNNLTVEQKSPPLPREKVQVSISVQLDSDGKRGHVKVDVAGRPRLEWTGPVATLTFPKNGYWNPRAHLVGLVSHGSLVSFYSLFTRTQPHLPPDDPTVHPVSGDELTPDKWYDLLPTVDTDRFSLNGSWLRFADGIASERRHYSRIVVPFLVDGDYDLSVQITQTEHNSPLGVFLPMGAGVVGESMLGGGQDESSLPAPPMGGSRTKTKSEIVVAQKHDFLFQVRQLIGDEVALSVEKDGQAYLHWKGPRSLVNIPTFTSLPRPDCLGFVVWEWPVHIHRMQLRVVQGTARRWKPEGPVASQVPPESLTNVVRVGSHSYWISPNPMNFGKALRTAHRLGGRLATISDASEAQLIKERFGDKSLWLSAFRKPNVKQGWVDERLRPLPFIGRWCSNQPDNTLWEYSLALEPKTHDWYDLRSNDDNIHALVEWGEESAFPSPAVLVQQPAFDLIREVLPKRDAIVGSWRQVYLPSPAIYGEPQDFARIGSPIRPTGDYTVKTKFRVSRSFEEVNWLLPVGEKWLGFRLGRDGALVFNVPGVARSPLAEKQRLQLDQEYSVELQVRRAAGTPSLQVLLEGEAIYSWQGPLTQWRHFHWHNPLHTLGIGAHRTPLEILEWSVTAEPDTLQRIEYERGEKLPFNEWIALWDQRSLPLPELTMGDWTGDERQAISAVEGHQRIAFPVEANGEFEFRAKVTQPRDAHEINFFLPLPGGGKGMASFGSGKAFLQLVPADRFQQSSYSLPPAADVLWRVRRQAGATGEVLVEGLVNGNEAYRWSGPAAALEPRGDWTLGPFAFGVGAHNGQVTFRGPELRLLSGEGWRLQRKVSPLRKIGIVNPTPVSPITSSLPSGVGKLAVSEPATPAGSKAATAPSPFALELAAAKNRLQTGEWKANFAAPEPFRKAALAATLINHAEPSTTPPVEALAACLLASDLAWAGREPWLAWEARKVALARYPEQYDAWNRRLLDKSSAAHDAAEAWRMGQVLLALAPELKPSEQRAQLAANLRKLEGAVRKESPFASRELARYRSQAEGMNDLLTAAHADGDEAAHEARGLAAALGSSDWNAGLQSMAEGKSPLALLAGKLAPVDRYRGSAADSEQFASLLGSRASAAQSAEGKALWLAGERFWLENAVLQAGGGAAPGVARKLEPAFAKAAKLSIPVDGSWGRTIISLQKAPQGSISADGDDFVRFNGDGNLDYQPVPTSSYVHELSLTLHSAQGTFVVQYGGFEGNKLVFFWRDAEKKFHYEHQHYRGGGWSWNGHGECLPGQLLHFTVYAHEGRHESIESGGDRRGARYTPELLQFSIRSEGNARATIQRCRFRAWTAVDAARLKTELPVFDAARDHSASAARRIHARNLTAESRPLPAKPADYCVVTSGTPMAAITAGKHLRPNGANQAPTVVTVSKPYWLGRYEVTQQEWVGVMGTNPSNLRGSSYLPVVNSGYWEIAEFCRRVTDQERRANRLPAGYVYRLPTEAEWERACLAQNTPVPATPDSWLPAEDVWHSSNASGRAHAIGELKPNAWGLFDMQGNVAESVLDAWSDAPSEPPAESTDPVVSPKPTSSLFTARGGSYWRGADETTPFHRQDHPATGTISRGFRLALAPEIPTR